MVREAVRHAALWLSSAAVLAAVAPVSTALAAEQITATPTLGGRLGGPGTLAISAGVTNTLGGIPSPLTQLSIALPPGATYNFATAPVCPLATILKAVGSPPVCPAGSRIGSGTASVEAALGTSTLDETAAMDIYLTSERPVRYEVWANGSMPIEETLTFPGALTPAAAPYGEQISVSVPPIPTVPGGSDASVVSLAFTVSEAHTVTTTRTVRRGGRTVRQTVKTTVALFDLPKKCSAPLPYDANANFEDGTTVTVSGGIACP